LFEGLSKGEIEDGSLDNGLIQGLLAENKEVDGEVMVVTEESSRTMRARNELSNKAIPVVSNRAVERES
jgi:hypothetical protein